MKQIRDAVYLIKYRNVHKAIKDKMGKASTCENVACAENGVKKYHWAKKKGREYTSNPNDYMSLCVKCHSIYDNTNRETYTSLDIEDTYYTAYEVMPPSLLKAFTTNHKSFIEWVNNSNNSQSLLDEIKREFENHCDFRQLYFGNVCEDFIVSGHTYKNINLALGINENKPIKSNLVHRFDIDNCMIVSARYERKRVGKYFFTSNDLNGFSDWAETKPEAIKNGYAEANLLIQKGNKCIELLNYISNKRAIEVGINIVGGRFCYNEGDE